MSTPNKATLDARTRSLCDQAWARGQEQRGDLEAALLRFVNSEQTFDNQVAIWAIRIVLIQLDWLELEAEPDET